VKPWSKKIETILGNAHGEGRKQLFEHEVYSILSHLGIATPTHSFVRHGEEITNETLSGFGSSRIVLKVVSRHITHKQKTGGVKVVHKDLDFVRYSFEKMKSAFENQKIKIEGILLVEYIEYSKDLGNENLLGFRESEAFGPIISFSKGGSDAEHFATYFSSPNLILAPINRQWAEALQSSTKIQKKYLDEGKQSYISKIIDTEVKLSDLAIQFSSFFDLGNSFSLTEFEINPFVFDHDGNYIAIDGFATFRKKENKSVNLEVKSTETLRPLFEPNGIAVIGISLTDMTNAGNIILSNLNTMKRKDVYGIGLREGLIKIRGRDVHIYASICEVEQPVDLAVIAVPAEATVPVVKECASRNVRAIILISGGFSEVHKNVEAEDQILQICSQHGVRLMGPNCLGVVYAGEGEGSGINTFFIPEEKFSINLEREKNVAILSQSGALGITEIYNLRNAISPKVIVSYGNQLDIDPSDLIQYFERDPMIDVIGLYIEGFKSGAGRKFFNTTAMCTKPIIVYKAGRTDEGKLATQSHTASIAGEYEVAKAAMKQAGLIVADSMIDHWDFIKTFALLHDLEAKGNRVAVIANAGYEKTYAADNLGELSLAELDAKTLGKLERIIFPYVKAGPLLDVTGMATDEMFEQCIDVLLGSNRVDALCISIVPQAVEIHTTDEEIDSYKENIAVRIVRMVRKHKKPAVVSVNVVSGADDSYNRFGQVLEAGGVPTFFTAERAMTCLNEFIRYRHIREKNLLSEWLK
jgi:acyl-CoA synthetase (NDP forming)